MIYALNLLKCIRQHHSFSRAQEWYYAPSYGIECHTRVYPTSSNSFVFN